MSLNKYKISFCTVSMNRLHHVKSTLPINIKNNIDYKNLEFILLDYNSSDGLEDWVYTNMKNEIESGLLVYFKTLDPIHFNRSHSRNMMFKLATGDIICNIDADNFTGKNFAHYINSIYSKKDNCIIVPDTKGKFYNLRDAVGRFCSKREDFISVTGYDEKMTSYGSEDIDLYSRIKRLGREEVIIEDINYLKSITHGDNERTENEYITLNLKSIFINYIDPNKSEVIFIYKDNNFEKGTLVPNKYNSFLPASIEEEEWESGTWHINNNNLFLKLSTGEVELYNSHDNFETLNITKGNVKNIFYRNDYKDFIFQALLIHPMITNEAKFQKNKNNKKLVINDCGFGSGKVFKNFNYQDPIMI